MVKLVEKNDSMIFTLILTEVCVDVQGESKKLDNF